MLRSHPLAENTFYDTAVEERLNYQPATFTGNPDFLSLEDSERNFLGYQDESNSFDELARYKLFLDFQDIPELQKARMLFLSSTNEKQYNNSQIPNPASRNLYRSWPVWYSHRDHEDVYHNADSTVEDLIEEEFMSL